MLKKKITYVDYDGNERTEDFYFNLSKAEITEMEMSINGGMVKYVNRIIAEKDSAKLVEIFKDIILKSYGEKSPDGKYFNKSNEIRDAFSHTEAYTELFMELVNDADAASTFINGIIPSVLVATSKN
jgi:hypothetical protein